MKRILTLVLGFGLTAFAAHGQQGRLTPAHPQLQKAKPVQAAPRVRLTGAEPAAQMPVSVPAADNFVGEQIMGYTYYDQQTNSSIPNRMYLWPDGRVSGIWNQSLNPASGYLDRGTGYNKSDLNRQFGPPPTTRVENTRSGFPAYDVTSTGEEWIISHVNDPNPANATDFKIHYAHKADGATAWTEGNLPGAAVTEQFGHLWPRFAIGGNDGQTLHIIALTTPQANAGNSAAAIIDGLNGQLRYWRSTDGGDTWDIQDVPLPGITADKWLGISGDAYAIDADGETVAILVSALFNDLVMIKSLDNGTTWEAPRVVHDFPLDLFGVDAGLYTFEDIAAYYNPDIFPDSLAMLSTDETGNVFVSPDGTVHVAAPTLFVQETDTTDAQYTYYPGSNLGIIYWNENMDDDDGIIAAYSPDLNADTVWGTATSEIFATGYGEAFSSVPTMGLDDDGRLYITYVAHHELAVDDATSQHHRQPFIVRSAPNSYATPSDWSEPEPVLQSPVSTDPIIVELSEYYFPVMAKRVDNEAHIQFQHDYEFGISLRFNPVQTPMENTIEYVGFPLYLFDVISTHNPAAAAIELSVLPNPVTDAAAQVIFELPAAADTRVELYTVAGTRVRTLEQGQLPAGRHQVAVDVDALPNGLYFVRVQADGAAGVRKLVIRQD